MYISKTIYRKGSKNRNIKWSKANLVAFDSLKKVGDAVEGYYLGVVSRPRVGKYHVFKTEFGNIAIPYYTSLSEGLVQNNKAYYFKITNRKVISFPTGIIKSFVVEIDKKRLLRCTR